MIPCAHVPCIGSPNGESDLWTDPIMDAEKWSKTLRNYDFVVLYITTESFKKEFSSLFEYGVVEPDTVYDLLFGLFLIGTHCCRKYIGCASQNFQNFTSHNCASRGIEFENKISNDFPIKPGSTFCHFSNSNFE